ncbi:hypothetical protein D3C86_951090 [compost metagenome]
MMCQRMGLPPISIMGLGFKPVSSEIRVPRPPARITAFIVAFFSIIYSTGATTFDSAGIDPSDRTAATNAIRENIANIFIK